MVIEVPVQETTEQVVITIEETIEQQSLGQMIEMVENDGWCRDATFNEIGQRCALGLASAASNGYGGMKRLVDILAKAIPTEWLEEHKYTTMGAKWNGGTFRGFVDNSARVASYNNTIENEQGIIDWFERARLAA